MGGRAEDPAELSIARGLRAVGAVLQRIPRHWAWIPVLAWMGLIFLLSSRPAPEIGGPGPVGNWFRNCGHAVLFGVLALWSALLVPRKNGWPNLERRTFLTVLALIIIYAVADEWHQSFTPHRDASACDVLTDVVGASLTLGAIVLAGGPRASDGKLAWLILIGIPSVMLSGAIASFGPRLLEGFSGP